MKKLLTIGVAYHKNMEFVDQGPYIPIQVGAGYNKDLGIQKDSDGDNISVDNPYCSEMSAMYWIWKNVDADYKGLFHYRRFLTYKKGNSLKVMRNIVLYIASKVISPFIPDSRCLCNFSSTLEIPQSEINEHLDIFAHDIYKDIEKGRYDLYCMKKLHYSTYTMQTHLKKAIGFWHYNYVVDLIAKDFPDFNVYFSQTLKDNKFVSCNMIIAKSDVFDQYCRLMFDIKDKYLHHMNAGIPNGVTNIAMLRDFGYIAELITDAYVRMISSRRLKVKYLNCMSVDMNVSGMSSVQASMWKRIKKNL